MLVFHHNFRHPHAHKGRCTRNHPPHKYTSSILTSQGHLFLSSPHQHSPSLSLPPSLSQPLLFSPFPLSQLLFSPRSHLPFISSPALLQLFTPNPSTLRSFTWYFCTKPRDVHIHKSTFNLIYLFLFQIYSCSCVQKSDFYLKDDLVWACLEVLST